ncbi:PAAR domain-containing protein [Burkholderia glumae]|uniref:PAAR domain-containing protein n=1 Tax=Burkholderia glumae TaxID=337 RepID=UPI001373DCE5|nr:PAAR domain-containing protein [Burkholderia glumae]
MSFGFARVGDETDHGGRIISGNDKVDFYGKKLAQVGDLTVCPKCTKHHWREVGLRSLE